MFNDIQQGLYYYDYLHGNLGLTHSFISEDKVKPLSKIVDKIYKIAIPDEASAGLKWKTNSTQSSQNQLPRRHRKPRWRASGYLQKTAAVKRISAMLRHVQHR